VEERLHPTSSAQTGGWSDDRWGARAGFPRHQPNPLRLPASEQYQNHLAAPTQSDVTCLLAVQESSAVGWAAGDALITGTHAVVTLHTSPGGQRHAQPSQRLMSGIPSLVMNGTEDSRFRINKPPLGGSEHRVGSKPPRNTNTRPGSSMKSRIALQPCYLQAALHPTGPR